MFSSAALSQRFEFLKSYKAIALAVSGGSDSLALLYMIARWHEALPDEARPDNRMLVLKTPLPTIHVLSVDHGFRPEAAKEAAFVVEQARALGFLAKGLVWEGAKPKQRVQELARKQRYTLLISYCKQNDIPVLLTAHQKEDQVETFLMRLARGSGIEGLSGIAVKTKMEDVLLCRPLLDLENSQLKQFLQSLGKIWIEDPSNEDRRFERIRLRQATSPAFNSLGLSKDKVALSIKRIGSARKAMDHFAKRLFKTAVFSHPAPIFYFSQDVLEDEPEELIIVLLRLIFAQQQFTAQQPELKKIERLAKVLIKRSSHKGCLAGYGISLFGGGVYFYRDNARMQDDSRAVYLEAGEDLIWDQRAIILQKQPSEPAIFVRPLGQKAFAPLRKNLLTQEKLPDWMQKMPAAAGASLLSLWQGKTLLAVPDLAYRAESYDTENFVIVKHRKGTSP